ncbi:MAG: DegT/DnrJ/EryC1/StrS family aminotransferase [Kiritimatiellota bacterium]|nr:DegT/DnrJ/EryC1/StrS family aminotransferase [Kiritimatiellota bacterium]
MPELALMGGKPVRTAAYPTWPIYDPEDLKALEGVLKSGQWGGNYSGDPGFIADEFAQEFAAFHDAKYGVPCMNGTIALECALAAAGIGYGDDVIVPSSTFVATATAVLFVDALPVFADVDPETLCLSPKSVESLITEHTRAIIPVHLGGTMADLDALEAICKKHGLLLIQDAAHAHGCQWNGKGIGAYGDMTCFSFQKLKLVTPGEGGVILTNNPAYMEACRVYINCGRVHESFQYAQPMIGGNLRMTELQAALLKSQFSRFPAQMETRLHNAAILTAGLKKIDGIKPVIGDERQTRISYYRYGFLYESEAFAGVPRAAFVKAVQAEGIPLQSESGQPVYRSPLFPWQNCRWKRLYGDRLDYSRVITPVSERTTRETACRLSHEVLLGSAADMVDIITAIEKVQRHAEELRAWEAPSNPLVITRG